MNSNRNKRVLVSPLNWGLGHATRLIPIIHQLIKQENTVFIGASSPSADILHQAFPQLTHFDLPGFKVKFATGKKQWFKLLLQIPLFLYWEKKEYKTTQKFIQSNKIDLIISDNRYGVRSKDILSILITHQTSPYLGRHFNFLRYIITKQIHHKIEKFNQCWIPDKKNKPYLTGELSNPFPKNIPIHRLGVLSRFANHDPQKTLNSEFPTPDILVIISGPEPHRTILEELIIKRLAHDKHKVVLIQGKPQQEITKYTVGQIEIYSHCDDLLFYHFLTNSKKIWCRSGYSTIMDLVALNRKALLIPTPGQYEQEYLANYLSLHFGFKTVLQNKIPTLKIQDISVY